MIRYDLSERLIHLTRDLDGISGEERFLEILKSKRINGNSRYILGKYKCVSFSEAPISAIGQIIAKKEKDNRYSPFGFMFSKEYLYKQGARPVIYQPRSEYDLLDDKIKYLHVKFDLSQKDKVDWTWEREWRLKTNYLSLNPDSVTLIIPTRDIEEKMKDDICNINMSYHQIDYPGIERLDWHFIVLEDLGYNFK